MSVRFKDYYEVLGVDRGASDDQIKRAFRDLARKYHPDVNKDEGADARFKEVNEAYEVLKDPEKRQRYDQLGANWQNGQHFDPPPGFEHMGFDFGGGQGGPSGFSDFFSMLFGQQGAGGSPFGGMGGGRSARAARGHDVEAVLSVRIEDLVQGDAQTVRLRNEQGELRTLEVKVPPGSKDGTKIRLSGQGEQGAGGARGDLYLRVSIEKHPRYQIDGFDLRVDVDVPPDLAVLGGKTDLRTPKGEVTLKIPPGTSSGHTMRLPGFGLPKDASARGDLLARVRIVVPSEPSDAERELYERLRALRDEEEPS